MSQSLSNLRKFVAPEIIFGSGARHSVANYAQTFGAKKALIVSDPGVVAAGWVKDVTKALDASGIQSVLFDQVSANPRVTEVMAGAEFYQEHQCDVIIGVGGGSPLDCAKGIGIVSVHGRSITEFEGIDTIHIAIPPIISIPTTAGTSADVSQFAIISDQSTRSKLSIVSKAVVPDVSLIDPDTTLSMDPFLTACTGMDALIHAIEAFVSSASGPLTDMYALDAIKILNDHLCKLVANPHDMFLREQVMLGAMKAGLAFSNAILGAVHAMSHSLGGYLDLAHGLCNSMVFEHVVSFNFDQAQDRFKVVAQTLGIDIRGMTSPQIKVALINHIVALKKSVGLGQTLAQSGVSVSDIPHLSARAILDPCMLTNPRASKKRDLEVVYEEAL